jgi:hypothetical protein
VAERNAIAIPIEHQMNRLDRERLRPNMPHARNKQSSAWIELNAKKTVSYDVVGLMVNGNALMQISAASSNNFEAVRTVASWFMVNLELAGKLVRRTSKSVEKVASGRTWKSVLALSNPVMRYGCKTAFALFCTSD